MSYAPGSQYILVGVKLYEMRDMGALAAILKATNKPFVG